MAKEATPSTGFSSTTGKATNFTWVINNFSKLNSDWLFSDVFIAGGYKWQLIVYPEGRYVEKGKGLWVYLRPSGSAKLPSGWSVNADFSLTLVNQIVEKDSIKKGTNHQFREEEADCGFLYFLYLTEHKDRSKGYVVNDTVIIETHVSVLDSLSVLNSNQQIEAKTMPLMHTASDTTHSASLASSSMSSQSSSTLLDKSKNLLEKLSSLKMTQKSTAASRSETLGSALQQQRKALKDYLALSSLEDIDQVNAFDEIERISLLLFQHSACSLERTILRDLLSRLANLKEIVPATRSSIENVRAQQNSFSEEGRCLVTILPRTRRTQFIGS